MIKYAGAILITLAGAWLGFALSAGLDRRVKALEDCVFALRQVCARVTSVRMPLPLAMEQSGGRLGKAAEGLRLGAYKAVEQAYFDSGFKQKDVDILANQVEMMMRMSAGDSDGVCGAAVMAMEFQLEQARGESARNSKLYRALGVCGGAAAAILFL